MRGVRECLEDLGLGTYTDTSAREGVDFYALRQLSKEDLKELGLTMGPRKKVLAAIEALTPASEPTAPTLPREAERRQITVMFCDLVGSTALSEKLDPEDLRTLMQAYQQACGKVIERYGGHVAQYLGDGLMTCFGWPAAHEDDAERSVRAGLEIIEAVKTVEAPTPLRVRIRIATGSAVVGETGAGDASVPKMAVGETPNMAARIRGTAGPDEVIIGPSTHKLTSNAFTSDDLGEQSFKGIVEAIRVWRIKGLAESEGRFEATRGSRLTPFVGREAEVALLLEKWEQTRDSEGQVFLLCGEPGIGKSRITQVLRERAAQEPHTRLRYQCSPYHTNSALHPIIEQLELTTGFERDDSIDTKLTKLENMVGVEGTVPALFAAMLSLDAGGRYPALNMSPQKQKEETLKALADQICSLAEKHPVLMIFEDAHWIDPSSQEVLDHIVPLIVNEPVLLVVTFRPEYEAPWSQGLDHLHTINLNRLGRKQASAMVARVTGGKPLPHEILDLIVAKTDGVPLFVEELTKTVIEAGIVRETEDAFELTGPLTDLAIPSTIQDSLMARLDRLAPVKEIAQIGACIGRVFNHELLAAVSDFGGENFDDSIRQLVGSELVFQSGVPPEVTYNFKHALIQDAAYESLLKSRRHRIHAKIAQVLKERFPTIVADQPERVARHCTEAGQIEEAIPLWLRAAQRAMRTSANREAVMHLKTGLRLVETLEESRERNLLELDFLNTLGTAYLLSSRYAIPEVESAYSRAEALRTKVGKAPQLFLTLTGLSVYHWVRGDLDASLAYATQLLEQAISSGDDDLLQVAHFIYGAGPSLFRGQIEEAAFLLDRVIEIYEPCKHAHLANLYGFDPGILARVYQGLVHWLMGSPKTSWKYMDEAFTLATKINHPLSLAATYALATWTKALCRDSEGAISWGSKAIAYCQEQGIPNWEAVSRLGRGSAYTESGNNTHAIEELTRGDAIYKAVGARLVWGDVFLIEANNAAGQTDEAIEIADKALDMIRARKEAWHESPIRRAKAKPLSLKHDLVPAEKEYLRAIDIAKQQKAQSWELRAAISLARLWQTQRKTREARELLAPIYSCFTESFGTADLTEAKALLVELKAA